MAFLVAAVFIIFTIIFGAVAGYCLNNDHPVVSTICGILAFCCIVGFIIVPFSMHTVDETEVCVVKQFGKVKEVVEEPGMFFDLWFGKSYKKIDTKTQEIKLDAMTYSSDAQVMTISLTFQYQFLGGEAKEILKEFGSTKALTERITSILMETPKAALSKRTAMDIIANRGVIKPEILEAAQNAIADKYPVEIKDVAISNIDFSDAFEQAVEEKMIAEQNKLKADYENEKKVATAKANAEAKKIEAEGEAEANRLLENSLTEQVLRDKYLDKWDGKLPSTMLGEDAGIMISVD